MRALSPETKERQARRRERFIAQRLQERQALDTAKQDPATLAAAAELFGIDLKKIPEDERDKLVTIFFI